MAMTICPDFDNKVSPPGDLRTGIKETDGPQSKINEHATGSLKPSVEESKSQTAELKSNGVSQQSTQLKENSTVRNSKVFTALQSNKSVAKSQTTEPKSKSLSQQSIQVNENPAVYAVSHQPENQSKQAAQASSGHTLDHSLC
jgi:hypothetical protein